MITNLLNGEHLIHKAVVDCDFSMIKLLLKKNPGLLDQLDSRGQTPLLCTITRCQDYRKMEVIEYLISQGANVNVIINCPEDPLHGITALQYAREHKQSGIITALIQAGAPDTPLVLNNLQNINFQSSAMQRIVSNVSETFFYYRKPTRLEHTTEEFSWRNEW